MKLVAAIIRPARLQAVCEALLALGVRGATVSDVEGFGAQVGHAVVYPGTEEVIDLLPRVEIEVAVQDDLARRVVDEIGKAAFTGRVGDGRIIVSALEAAVRIRTGETGDDAL